MASHVVVLLTSTRCDQDPQTRCIMRVIGPFGTALEAAAEAERWPEWTTPHLMLMDSAHAAHALSGFDHSAQVS